MAKDNVGDDPEPGLMMIRTRSTIGNDPYGRWLVEVAYASEPDGGLLPVDVHVRLLPPDASYHDKAWAGRVITKADELLGLDPLPPGGLSRRMLTQVDLSAGQRGVRAAASATARLTGKRSPVLDRLARGSRPRTTGRPPSRSQAEVLRLLLATEEGLARGDTLAQVASANALSRESLRDLLSWARHDARPALFTNPGRGRRGGHLTTYARELLDQQKGQQP